MPSVSSASLTSLANSTNSAREKASDTYNQFLVLLTTQLQNQDPLDPMESSEFTNQLVQFSQVEQAILGNEKLDTLLQQVNGNQIGQSIGYIGKDVFYNGNTVYNDGTPTKIGYAIDGEAAESKLRIFDADDNIIRTLTIEPGSISGNITWDGKDDNGITAPVDKVYSMRIDAFDSENNPIDGFTGVPARITGVETLDGILYLALNGDRRIEASAVLSITEPEATT